ncbi:MAG: DUF4403 family protein [Chromatiaceae bacterium]|nr:DUF4403 family protein [Zoogloeaceae bacterium]MCP5426638.1 DUF4403 family protein [Chromatiaceae bacterium]
MPGPFVHWVLHQPVNGYTCKVTVANIDVTSKVMDVMNHVASGVTDRAKQQILSESSKLHDLANEAWNTIATPIPLGSFGYAEMRPESVSLGRLAIANETLSATLSISAKPLFMLGTPPATTPLQVPDFQPGGAVSDQFSIMALVRLPFQTLED